MLLNKNLDVSIVSANYNNAPYLEVFLNSILESTYLPKEIIIVDDKSTDNSLDILSKYSMSYDIITVIKLENNQGFAKALNIGLEKATGKYVARIDPDDCMHPQRIEKQYFYLTNHPSITAIGSNAFYFKHSIKNQLFKSNFPVNTQIIHDRYLKGEHGLLHGTVMIKSDIIKLYQYRQKNVPAEDYDIFSRILRDGHIFFNFKECLTGVRIHSNSVSNSLPYSTIKKTYDLRKEIFNKSTPKIKIFIMYFHMKFYRKYLFEDNKVKAIYYLVISSIFRPDKVFRKFKIW
ncbi:glycosyltransferase [Fulvivirga ulvae]|uniref:glycosyltransferase family 2 protein n=1 Tax=Fulvivirga ulvae TaxID=2904245 RepID=UPI001F2BFD18|nr:glycosyltransferase family 2 protein [Fulvivirga ulvae]UII34296.1 glycosyltransferase [Fulvivirga ulvae]